MSKHPGSRINKNILQYIGSKNKSKIVRKQIHQTNIRVVWLCVHSWNLKLRTMVGVNRDIRQSTNKVWW